MTDWKKLKDEPLHSGFLKVNRRSYQISKHEGGSMEITREVVAQGKHVVGILPVDMITRRFLLVEQWRPGPEDWVHEIIAGYVDEGETPEEAAEREMREETCCEPYGKPELIGAFYTSPGVSEEKITVFSTGYKFAEFNPEFFSGVQEEQEDILVKEIRFDDLARTIRLSCDAKTLVALRWLQCKLMKKLLS